MEKEFWGYFLTDILNLVFASIAIVYFTRVIARDLWRGYRKRTYWIPGKYLVLSAFTIEALSYLDVASVSLSDSPNTWGMSLLLGNHLLIDNGRLIICVFMGYLLPGMAASGSRDQWGDVLALAISSISNIASELYFLCKADYIFNNIEDNFSDYQFDNFFEYDVLSRLQRNPLILRWYKATSLCTVVAVVFLLVLLASVIPTGSTIREILSQRIAGALAVPRVEVKLEGKSREEEFQDKVLKSWVLAHVCRPDYVIARSVMSSAAAMVVTLRIGVSIAKFLKYNYIAEYHDHGLDILQVLVLAIQFLFIGVGWLAICWRSATAVHFFPKSGRGMFRNIFRVDNLWKRRVMEQRYRWQSQIADLKAENSDEFPRDPQILLLIIAEKSCVPYALTKLQCLVVIFANVCWFLSSIVIGNPLLRWLFVRNDCAKDLDKYNDILQRVKMPEETEDQLRIANRKAIKQTEELMEKGTQAGVRCTELIDFIKDQTVSEPKFEALETVEDSFSSLEKMCWMMKAVCYFEIIVEVLPERKERDEKLLGQAADIMNFFDRVDIDDDEMGLLNSLGRKADRVFQRVRIPQNQPGEKVRSVSEAKERIEKIVMEHRKLLEPNMNSMSAMDEMEQEKHLEENRSMLVHEGAMDVREIAHSYNVYKVGTYLLQTIGDVEVEDLEKMEKDTEEAFSNLIGYCVLQLKLLLEKTCVNWARGFDEDMLRKAVYIAGKVKVVLEQSKVRLQSADATIALYKCFQSPAQLSHFWRFRTAFKNCFKCKIFSSRFATMAV